MKIQYVEQQHGSSSSPDCVIKVSEDKEISGCTSCSPIPAPRMVSFAAEGDNVVHDVLPLTEYTPNEVSACWFSKAEYNSFKRNSLVTLQLNRAGELAANDNNPEHTMRGLECRTRECTDSRRLLRFQAAAAVFNEQARQQDLGIQDPEALSEAYHSLSWHSMYDAHTQGMADEQDAQALLTAEDRLFVAPRTRASSSLLSKIISIERTAKPEEVSASSLLSTTKPSDSAGLDGVFFATSTNTNNAFNLNAFFNDMSLGMAVPVAAA